MVNKDEYMGWVGLGHSVDGFELCQVVENGPADNPGVRGAISEGNVLRPLERPGRHQARRYFDKKTLHPACALILRFPTPHERNARKHIKRLRLSKAR